MEALRPKALGTPVKWPRRGWGGCCSVRCGGSEEPQGMGPRSLRCFLIFLFSCLLPPTPVPTPAQVRGG